MKAQIEKIIQADEDAGKLLEASRAEALKINDEAQRKAKEIFDQRERELGNAIRATEEGILAEAKVRAASIREEADRYLDKIESKKREHFEEQMKNLLKMVTDF